MPNVAQYRFDDSVQCDTCMTTHNYCIEFLLIPMNLINSCNTWIGTATYFGIAVSQG